MPYFTKTPLAKASLLATLMTLPLTAVAAEPAQLAATYVQENVAAWANDPALVTALLQQNEAHASLSQGDIDSLDLLWRAETGSADSDLIKSVLNNDASAFLAEKVIAAGGTITEVFVMDNRGLNAAASVVTSDYWQGDEAKFTETYPKGPTAMHVGDVEYDESTLTYQIQVSFPVVNPADGTAIGAITVALNAEMM